MFVAEEDSGWSVVRDRHVGRVSESLCFGRFVEPDPLGYEDGLNWYDYAHGDPANWVDPTGANCADMGLTTKRAGDSYVDDKGAAVVVAELCGGPSSPGRHGGGNGGAGSGVGVGLGGSGGTPAQSSELPKMPTKPETLTCKKYSTESGCRTGCGFA